MYTHYQILSTSLLCECYMYLKCNSKIWQRHGIETTFPAFGFTVETFECLSHILHEYVLLSHLLFWQDESTI